MIEYQKTYSRSEWVIGEHVLEGNPVLPGAAYVEMAIACAQAASGKFVRMKDRPPKDGQARMRAYSHSQ